MSDYRPDDPVAHQVMADFEFVWDALVERYEFINLHSLPDGGCCIHLGHKELGCKSPTVVAALMHAVDHLKGDNALADAMVEDTIRKLLGNDGG